MTSFLPFLSFDLVMGRALVYLGRVTNQRQDAKVPDGAKWRGDRRARIVSAARKLLAEEGYDRVTMKQVAREAGVAQGLIHYYFSGKDEILVEVLVQTSEEYADEAGRLARSLPEGESLSEAALATVKERVFRQPEWHRLRYELFAMGLRKPGFLTGVAALLESGRSGISSTLDRVSGEQDHGRGTARDPEREALAAVLLACFDGLALQKLADPEGFDLDAAYEVLAKMVRG